MRKQLESELKEIAISILSNDYDTDIETIKQQAAALYEQLTVLVYTNNNLKKEIKAITNEPVKETTTKEVSTSRPAPQTPIAKETTLPPTKLSVTEQTPTPAIEIKTPVVESPDLLFELEELTAGFKNLPEFEPAIKKTIEKPISGTPIKKEINKTTTDSTGIKTKSSLNDRLNRGINIGLNDRLAFVKHLFNNNLDDYTRVISQLNTLESSSGAKNFIEQMVKPEYKNWEGKEAFEERFFNIVFSKFDH